MPENENACPTLLLEYSYTASYSKYKTVEGKLPNESASNYFYSFQGNCYTAISLLLFKILLVTLFPITKSLSHPTS